MFWTVSRTQRTNGLSVDATIFGISLWNLDGYLDRSAMGETCEK